MILCFVQIDDASMMVRRRVRFESQYHCQYVFFWSSFFREGADLSTDEWSN